jgi:hypothetical protein
VRASVRPSPELPARPREHKAEIVAPPRQGTEAALPPEPEPVELEYRKGMAMDSVPEPYHDAWGRLQCQRPTAVSEDAWRLAVNDAGLFLDAWGSLAVEFEWTPGDLFDLPRDGKQGGLVWFLNGESVRSLGPEHMVAECGRVFDR